MADIDVNLKFSDGDILTRLNQIEKEFGELNTQVAKTGKSLDTDFNASTKSFSTSVGGLTTSLGALGGALGGLSVGAIALEAVKAADAFNLLQGSLKRVSSGDAETATAKFRELSKISDELGLKNTELIGTYTSLAQRGFKPTGDELRKLIDIAKASNKDINQLAEAILDIQQGEGERLKEFGIKSKIAGDQITFTFNGVSKTVKNSADEINKAILSFGDLASIQGAAAAASNNLEAAQNRLSNATTSLLANIGQAGTGFASNIVNGFGGIADAINETLFPTQALDKEFDNQRIVVATLDNELPKLTERYKVLAGQKKLNKKEQEELNTVTARIAELAPVAAEGFGKYSDGLRINLEVLRTYNIEQKKLFKDLAETELFSTRARLTNIKLERQQLEEQQKATDKFELGSAAKGQIKLNLANKNAALIREQIELDKKSREAQEQLELIATGQIISLKKNTEEKVKNAKATTELSDKEKKAAEDKIKRANDDIAKLQGDSDKSRVKTEADNNEQIAINERDLQLKLLAEREKTLNAEIKAAGLRVDITREIEDIRLGIIEEAELKIRKARQRDLNTQFGIEDTVKALKNEANNINFDDFKLPENNALATAILDPKEFEKQFKEINKNAKLGADELNAVIKELIGTANVDLDKISDPLLRLKLKIQSALGLDDAQLGVIQDQFSNLANSFADFYFAQNEAAAKAQEDLASSLDKRIELQTKALDKELEAQKQGSANSVETTKAELALLEQQRSEALTKANAEREKNRKAQLISDGISQVSNLITAGSEIIKGFSKIPVVGVILGIAAIGAMLAGFASLKAKSQASVPKLRLGRDPKKGYEAKGATHEGGGILAEIEDSEFVMGTKQSKQHAPFLRRMLNNEFDGVNLDSMMHNSRLASSVNRTSNNLISAKHSQERFMLSQAIEKQTEQLIKAQQENWHVTSIDNKLVKIKTTNRGTRIEKIKI